MIDPTEFFDIVSDKANRDSTVRRNFLAHIDDNYNPSRYPQELPRVMSPGQPLSLKGFRCLDSYRPVPGDRVLLTPVGTSDYVIVGAVDPNYEDQENASLFMDDPSLPFRRGDRVFTIDNHGTTQNQGGGSGSSIQWTSQQYTDMNGMNDPFSFWGGLLPENPPPVHRVTPSYPGFYRVEGRVVFPAATGGTADWRRVEVRFADPAAPIRGADFRTSNINGGSLRTTLSFSTLPIWFNGTTDVFTVRASGSVGSGSPFLDGADASFINVFYEGYF